MSQAIDLSIWPEKFCPSVPYAWLRHERKILGIYTCCAWLFYSTLLPGEFFYAKLRHFTMGHFRVPRGLCFKTGVGTRRLIWKSFFILIHSPITFELNRAEWQFTKNTVRAEVRKYLREKNPVRKKLNRKSGWDPWLMLRKAHPTKTTRLEALCPHLLSMYSNKHGKLEIIIRNENKLKPLRNSNCH